MINRLNAAILIAEFLISKQVDILDLNLMLGDMKSSLGYCQDALRHYESVFYEAPEGKNKLLAALNSGAVCLNTCQYQKALSFLEKVSSIQAPELAVQANYLRGWIAMYQGNFQTAANLLRKNIYKAQFFEDYDTKASSYHFLARTNYEVNKFERAIELLKKQYLILEKKQAPPDKIAHSFRWLARCYWKLQDLQSTEHYLSIARHLFVIWG
ncbi:MAG: hypothetical protein SVX43_06425 [Cyanobacteriota bacterium]|nr:hypothetical protein [Cyanobacteriota bacterium]